LPERRTDPLRCGTTIDRLSISLNAALWYLDVDTEADIRTPTPGAERLEVDVDVDPLTWMVGLTYRF